MAAKWSILSVTDLHYAAPETNLVGDPKELGQVPSYLDNVFSDYKAILKVCAPRSFDVIAVCGDLTTRGRPEGFKRFEADSLHLLRSLGRIPKSLCVVPGNHDVTWGLDPRQPGSFDQKFRAFGDLLDQQQFTSCLIPTGELGPSGSDQLTFRPPQNGPIHVDHERKVIVLCLNSAIRCGELNLPLHEDVANPLEQAIAAASADARPALETVAKSLRPFLLRDVAQVTRTQQERVDEQLRHLRTDLASDWPSYLRIAVLHHHLLPFPAQVTEHRGYELLVDASHVLTLLTNFQFDLALTGHKHQPYVVTHTSGDHEMLIVGGPTVGGAAIAGNFRGVRIIDVHEDGQTRTFRVADVKVEFGAAGVETARKGAQPHTIVRHRSDFANRAATLGYAYREVASMTLIDADGDARRVVECEDLKITGPTGASRSDRHQLDLPTTSGYLANVSASGKGFDIDVQPPIPPDERPQAFSTTLQFKQSVGEGPASYSYRWFAVNAIALDQNQIPPSRDGRSESSKLEFTHFTVEDPIEELSVIVRFPAGYEPGAPRLRVSSPKPGDANGHNWKRRRDIEDELRERRTLRYYDALNTAALRVSQPAQGLSYGIEWDIPEVKAVDDPDRTTLDAFWQGWSSGGTIGEHAPARLLELLARLLVAVREGLAPRWIGAIDASIMWFDEEADLPLRVLVAAIQQKRKGGAEYEYDQLPYDNVGLRYGDGIAGRAFKTNRPRVYVAPRNRERAESPDYYTRTKGVEPHRVLVSLPLHTPAGEALFAENRQVYESKRPYAVLSVGSTRPDCPLARFSKGEHDLELLSFQHQASRLLFDEIRTIVQS